MSARLKKLQGEVAAVRHRLEVWAVRLEALRLRAAGPREAGADVVAPAAVSPTEAPQVPPTPLFHGLGLGDGALDDVELHFEVLDTEDPGREGR
jgi:hypothetical protein